MPRLRRAVWAEATQRLEASGESLIAWRLLGCVRQGGPITQSNIAGLIGQHPAGVCRMLDGLERRGLVTRTRDARDRRKVMVSLTPAGLEQWQALLPDIVDSLGNALEPLSDAELRTLRDLMRKVVLEPNGASRRRR